jgi:hypothetical protein
MDLAVIAIHTYAFVFTPCRCRSWVNSLAPRSTKHKQHLAKSTGAATWSENRRGREVN